MLPYQHPSVSVCRRGAGDPGSDPLRIVVWVRGEHDLATRVRLTATIAEAARLDDADVAVDLSGITFMDASTIGALVLASNRLLDDAHSLSVRAPSPRARRLLEVCGLTGMIDGADGSVQPPTAPALDSWVAVPTTDRPPDAAPQPVAHELPPREPAHGAAPQDLASAGSAHRHRASS